MGRPRASATILLMALPLTALPLLGGCVVDVASSDAPVRVSSSAPGSAPRGTPPVRRVAPSSGVERVTVTGTLAPGVECTALRGDDGKRYSLLNAPTGARVGDRVRIVGRVERVSFCQSGTTLTMIDGEVLR